MEPITEVNRVALTLAPLMLGGDAFEYRRLKNGDKPDWDLSSITGSEGGVFFANNLAYEPDSNTRTFTFSPRDAALSFALPSYLNDPVEVFRIDKNGVHDVKHEVRDGGLEVRDRIRVVGIYVAAAERGLRKRLAEANASLLRTEGSYGSQEEVLGGLKAITERR